MPDFATRRGAGCQIAARTISGVDGLVTTRTVSPPGVRCTISYRSDHAVHTNPAGAVRTRRFGANKTALAR
jgi:hypothetical protein